MVRFITLLNEETKALFGAKVANFDYIAIIDKLNRLILVEIDRQAFREVRRKSVSIITPLVHKVKPYIPGIQDVSTTAEQCWMAVDSDNKRIYVVVLLLTTIAGKDLQIIGVVQFDDMQTDISKIYPLEGHIGTNHTYLGVMAKENVVYSDTETIEGLTHLLLYHKEKEMRILADRLIVTDDDRKHYKITSTKLQLAPEKPIPFAPLPSDLKEIKMDFSTGLGILEISSEQKE